MRFPSAIRSNTFGPTVLGHVEIFYKNEWGTICNQNFTEVNAQVLCKGAGYEDGEYSNNRWNQGYATKASKIWLDNVKCYGNESWIGECQHRGWGLHKCTHSQNIGVHCMSKSMFIVDILWITSGSRQSVESSS